MPARTSWGDNFTQYFDAASIFPSGLFTVLLYGLNDKGTIRSVFKHLIRQIHD